jgi:hypothetical protein
MFDYDPNKDDSGENKDLDPEEVNNLDFLCLIWKFRLSISLTSQLKKKLKLKCPKFCRKKKTKNQVLCLKVMVGLKIAFFN